MVRRGEYLERAVVIPGTPALDALYHRGRRSCGILILPPGPEEGGMTSTTIAELAWALTRAGHPTLRFEYPGVGGSGGFFGLEAATEAAARGIEHLEACLAGSERASTPAIGLAGVGLGGALAARLALDREDVDRYLVQPDPEVLLAGPSADRLGGEVVLVAAREDPETRRAAWARWLKPARNGRMMVVPDADSAWRRQLVVLGKAAAELFSPPGLLEL